MVFKMKILGIDTSSANASTCILDEQTVLIELNNQEEKTHSQKLMPIIDEAFQKANLALDDIRLIACGLGPGSFTGVRIGIATAKAFADSKDLACVGITSLEALAYNLNHEGYICSLINANHDNVYAGFFHITLKNNYLQTLQSDFAFLDLKDKNNKLIDSSLLDFIENNSKITLEYNVPLYFVGDAIYNYQDLLQNLSISQNHKIILASKEQCILSSISVAKVGYTKYKNGNYGDSSILSPIYLRKSQAELALDKKIKGLQAY